MDRIACVAHAFVMTWLAKKTPFAFASTGERVARKKAALKETTRAGDLKNADRGATNEALAAAKAAFVDAAAREARRAAGAFLETWREYLHALVSFEALAPHAITDVTNAAGRVTVLMRDSFVESFRVADRAFAEALVDTQAFQAHADEVLRF
mgnify:CR=1 FL=1